MERGSNMVGHLLLYSSWLTTLIVGRSGRGRQECGHGCGIRKNVCGGQEAVHGKEEIESPLNSVLRRRRRRTRRRRRSRKKRYIM